MVHTLNYVFLALFHEFRVLTETVSSQTTLFEKRVVRVLTELAGSSRTPRLVRELPIRRTLTITYTQIYQNVQYQYFSFKLRWKSGNALPRFASGVRMAS